MKRIYQYGIGLLAVALTAAGCSQEEPKDSPEPMASTLKVTIKQPTTRAIAEIGQDVAAEEAVVKAYTLYVFDASDGSFLVQKPGDPSRTTEIPVPEAVTVQVMAIVNPGTAGTPDLTEGDTWADLAGYAVSLGSQSPVLVPEYGLTMVGQSAVETVATVLAGDGDIEVPVKRVAAKVVLGTVNFDANMFSLSQLREMLQFDITGVGVQRVRSEVAINGWGEAALAWAATATTPQYYGGFTTMANDGGAASVSASYTADTDMLWDAHTEGLINATLEGLVNGAIDLVDAVTSVVGLDLMDYVIDDLLTYLDGIPITNLAYAPAQLLLTAVENLVTAVEEQVLTPFDNYFYVLPNTATMSTLLTLRGEMGSEEDAEEQFYPIVINNETATAGANAVPAEVGDSQIHPNTIYRINLTFENMVGVPDPDDSDKPASLTATIVPAEWANVSQNVTW